MLINGDIASDNINDTLSSIKGQIEKIHFHQEFSSKEISTFEKISKELCDYMKDKPDSLQIRILDILEVLSRNELTSKILKVNCYDYFVELFKERKNYIDLMKILDNFGHINDIEGILIHAIDLKDVDLLSRYLTTLNFSKFKVNRIKTIKFLNNKLKNLEQNENLLKEVIRKLIKKLE